MTRRRPARRSRAAAVGLSGAAMLGTGLGMASAQTAADDTASAAETPAITVITDQLPVAPESSTTTAPVIRLDAGPKVLTAPAPVPQTRTSQSRGAAPTLPQSGGAAPQTRSAPAVASAPAAQAAPAPPPPTAAPAPAPAPAPQTQSNGSR